MADTHELMSKIILESRQISQNNMRLLEQLHMAQDMSKKLKDDVASLQNEYNSKEDPKKKFDDQQFREMELALARANTRAYELEKMLGERDIQIDSLKEEMDSHKKKLNTKDVMIGELGRNLKDKDNMFESEGTERQSLSRQIEELQLELEQKDMELAHLHEIVDKLHIGFSEKEDEARRALSSEDLGKSELNRLIQDNEGQRKKATQLEKNVSILRDDLLIKDQIIHSMQKKELEKQKGIRNLTQEFTGLQEQLKILDETNKDVLRRMNKTESRSRMLEQELAHQVEINKKLEIEYEAVLNMNSMKYETRLKALIAGSTRVQLNLQTEIELLKSKMEKKMPEPVPNAAPPRTELKPKELKQTPVVIDESKGYTMADPEDLVPMIRTAMDHGDAQEHIRSTLLISGYHRDTIDQALLKISKKEKI